MSRKCAAVAGRAYIDCWPHGYQMQTSSRNMNNKLRGASHVRTVPASYNPECSGGGSAYTSMRWYAKCIGRRKSFRLLVHSELSIARFNLPLSLSFRCSFSSACNPLAGALFLARASSLFFVLTTCYSILFRLYTLSLRRYKKGFTCTWSINFEYRFSLQQWIYHQIYMSNQYMYITYM